VEKTEQELLQDVLEARHKVNEIDDALTAAKEVKEKSEAILVEYMDNRELKSFKSSTLNCSVVRKETLYVSIDKDRKDEAMRWIEEDCGRGDMIKPSIHNKTLSSFIGERLKTGLTIPQELFKYFFKPELAITIAKGGN
jgi:hypothetical protein